MGTNYYHEKILCEHCGNTERLHVGKSSFGWCFALRVYPDLGIIDLPDWDARAEAGGRFVDEYGRPISWPDLHAEIAERPAGSRRDKIDGDHCIGHGDGPWDLIVGEFS